MTGQTRGVSTAMIINPAGRAVNPTIEALQSALHDYANTHTNPQYAGILLGAPHPPGALGRNDQS